MLFFRSALLALAPAAGLAAVLSLDCAPGGNFNLGHWYLQLPIGPKSRVDSVASRNLQGCHGYSSNVFYTHATTGHMVLKAPGNPALTGCTTTGGSRHCRTELREVEPGSGAHASWRPNQTNVLHVTMKVVKADDGAHGTAIGQVFADGQGPIAEVYYNRQGDIGVGARPGPGTKQVITTVGQVPLGVLFDYSLSYSERLLSVAVNGRRVPLKTDGWGSPNCYFKAGNYNQGKSAAESEVHIAAIQVTHS